MNTRHKDTRETMDTAATIPQVQSYRMPAPGTWAANRTDWRPQPKRCALLVHDMQHYFLKCYRAEASPLTELLANTLLLRQRCHALDIPVFYSQADAQTPAQRGLVSAFWGPGMQAAPSATGIVDALRRTPKDMVIRKHRYSAFHRTDLLEKLRNRGRDQLLICGVYAHLGCMATALDAFMNDVQPFMVSDALADFSQADHLMALSYVAQGCGSVLSNAEVLLALDAFAP